MPKKKPITLEEITARITTFRDARDWKKYHTPKDQAISISLEAAELLEHFLWKDTNESQKHLQKAKEAVAAELSDILHNVLLMSHDLGIDLNEASILKMEENDKKYPVDKVKGKYQKYTEIK